MSTKQSIDFKKQLIKRLLFNKDYDGTVSEIESTLQHSDYLREIPYPEIKKRAQQLELEIQELESKELSGTLVD